MLVYVIDDSKAVRSILIKMLKGFQFETTEAENGQQALDCLAAGGKPDLFLVNWNMPLINGLQFIQRVRADANYAKVPLLIVSAECAPETIANATAAGANGYLVKPVTSNALRESLTSLGVHVPAASPPVPGNTEDAAIATASAPATTPDKPTPDKPTPDNPTRPHTPAVSGSPGSSPTSPTHVTQVLVVDDSVVVRGIVSKLLKQDPEIRVANTAADGLIALDKLEQHKVDVILLDIEMPHMDGFELLKALREKNNRTPVIMFSSLTDRGGAATIEALMLGAKDYVMKPGGAYMTNTAAGEKAILEELIPKIKQFACKAPLTIARGTAPIVPKQPTTPAVRRVDAVVIAVSTGGPKALATLIPQLGDDLPVPVLIVQHMPADFTRHLADRLTVECGFPVTEAIHSQTVAPGNILLAPGGVHMSVKRSQQIVRVTLDKAPPINSCRPSADRLFHSASTAYGSHVLGVVMTGMGSDGSDGCKAIKQAGGQVIVQDEASSVVWGMPGSAVQSGCADLIVPLDKLAATIKTRTRRSLPGATGRASREEPD